jgi:glycosyltransferase involved in cell wall biosynthesis
MIVTHIHKITGVGGSERHLLALLPALRARGIDARFVGLDVAGTDARRFHEALDELGVPRQQVRCGRDVSPRMVRDLVTALRRDRPDLLHTHLVHADIYGSMASRRLDVPFVSSRHNDDRYLAGLFRYVDRTFARRASSLIAISDAVRRFLESVGLPPEKLVTIRYGLDALPTAASELTPGAAGVPPDAPLILAIGRLTAQKDHPTLLRAFARIHQERPEAVLAILGIGPLEHETRHLVSELGLDTSVILPGRLEVRDWLARANVFAHTSRWEGFGIVLLEAMLAGLPIVATRVSAIPEVVDDNTTGLLLEAGDHAGIADALLELLADPARATAMGEAGRERARTDFSVARMTDQTIAVYESA